MMLRRFVLTQNELDRNFRQGTLSSLGVRHTGNDTRKFGLYATCDVPPDTVIWVEVGNERLTASDLAMLTGDRRRWAHYGFQADRDTMSVPRQIGTNEPDCDIGFCINHSCDPNTLFCEVALPDGSITYGQYTVRRVLMGQEVTYAYHTTETGLDDETAFHCTCGASDCVGYYTTTNHFQQKAVLERLAGKYGPYGVLPHVVAWVLAIYPDARIGNGLRLDTEHPRLVSLAAMVDLDGAGMKRWA